MTKNLKSRTLRASFVELCRVGRAAGRTVRHRHHPGPVAAARAVRPDCDADDLHGRRADVPRQRLRHALIQKQDATQTDCCSIFYFNIVVGVVAAGLLCLAAPWIAAFYGQPLLTPLARVLSLNIIINSFVLIQTVLIAKQIDFKTQTKVSLIATVLSGSIGVTLALRGFGVWSLALQQVCGALLRTVLLWFFNACAPFAASSASARFGGCSRSDRACWPRACWTRSSRTCIWSSSASFFGRHLGVLHPRDGSNRCPPAACREWWAA